MVSGWCPCVPLGRRQSPAQQQQQQQPQSSSRAPFTVSGATDRADMVQMFYYENHGKCCKKLLRYNGYPNKVLLFPEEGWARSASSSYWTLTPFWWSRSRCKVVEVAGTRRYSTQAKMVDTGTGTLYIIGSFKRMTTDPDFKVWIYILKFIKCVFLKSKFRFQLFLFLIKIICQNKMWYFLICKIIRLLYPPIAILMKCVTSCQNFLS
ncbi:uncharacterized protein [Temnothorax longispinosus]|uniref:uncharacterized protein isoform X1 n=1 Tax=Temnothorax longispinosus TaxID=300112 RepID=UPI003A993ACB